MNSQEIFSLALGLQSPWEIKEIKLENGEDEKVGKTLHIHIGFIRGSKFSDGLGVLHGVHDTVSRTWRHLNFFEHECYLHCDVPRIRPKAGKVSQVSVPWARKGSGFTLLFEAFSMSLIEAEMPVNKVGEVVNEYPNRIWTIFNYWLNVAYSEADHSGIKELGVDETSEKKGHKYITIGVDMETRRVIHATKGKGADTITQIREYLETKGSRAEDIERVCIDLSPAFISGVTKEFENASITFDRFHVKKLLNEAMDEVRKQQRWEHEILKGHKYTFLKGNSKLTTRQRSERNELIELLPVLGEAYRLKILFDDFWEMEDVAEAEAFLTFWCDLAEEAKIHPFIKFVNTLKSHWTGIVNYIESNLSNGILEGINSKIQLAKRRARGYRNTENFINMIYLIAGKLKFNYPL